MNDATRELLAVLDPLPYRDRLRHVVAWARNAPDRAQVCAELRDRGPYERHLALVVAMSTGDTDGIRHALGDPLSRLRAVALGAALRSGQLTVLPDGLAAVDRRAVYRRLRGLGRPEIADALIGRVLDRHGRAEAATLLPACSEATIRAMLPLLEHRISLAALARRHPGAVHDRARELLSATEPRYRTALWPRLAQGVLRGGVDSALALLEEFAPEDRLPGRLSAYGRIAVVHPQRVVDLLTAPGRAAWLRRQSLPPNLLRRLAVLPDTALVPLARAFRENARALSRLLAALPPARRGALHDLAVADADTRFQVPQPQVVEVLPAAVRIREARRVLTLASIQENEDLVWEWSAFLPWPEAVAALEPAIGSGDADDRSLGYALLVKAALRGRDPEPVAEVLTRLLRLRNEQDPVRQSALGQLYRAGRLLTAGSAADLTRIVIDVTEARDTSAGTRAALGRLAGAVLQHHAGVPELAEWALFTYERLTAVIVPPLTRMRRGGEVAVFGRLRQWAEAALDRGSPGPLFALAGALGRRGHDLPELQGLLRRCIDPGMLESTARAAIPLLLDDPRTRSARVAEVLALDPTAVAVPIVWHTVSATRTDLLDVVFADRAHGRFVPDGLRWVPSSVRFPERWLPRQQRHLVDLMERVVDDGEVPEHRRAAALRAAARVPVAGAELVRKHADSPVTVLAEAALAALTWTDQPDLALPVLLAHAGGDRARVALYAAGRAVRHIDPERLPDLLGPLLSGPVKVTSRKAAVRMLADYGPPATMDILRDAYRAGGQHRDVRAAVVSVARRHLENPVSWEILDSASGGTREEVRAFLDVRPWSIAEEHRPRYAALIVGACRSADREIRREAFDELPPWTRWAGDVSALVTDRVVDVGESMTGHDIQDLVASGGTGWLGEALDRLLALDAADPAPGGPGADRPARRRAEALIRATTTVIDSEVRAELRIPVRRMLGAPAYRSLAVLTLVDLGRLDDLDEIAGLCAGRPDLAARAADRAGTRLRQLPDLIDVAFLGPLITRLTGRADPAGGLLAVALVRVGATFGWADPWRDRLLALREHPEDAVREQAYSIDMT